MLPKLTYHYQVVHTGDKNKFREQIVDFAEQGFEVQEISTCKDSLGIAFTALMRKKPEAPILDNGPGPDNTGGTPAAGKVVPFTKLRAVA